MKQKSYKTNNIHLLVFSHIHSMETIIHLEISDPTTPPVILNPFHRCKIVSEEILYEPELDHKYDGDIDEYDYDTESTTTEYGSTHEDDDKHDDYEDEDEDNDDPHDALMMYEFEHLNHDECDAIFESCIHLMTDYIATHPSQVNDPKFHTLFKSAIYEMVLMTVLTEELFFHTIMRQEITYIFNVALRVFFHTISPPRSHPHAKILARNNHNQKHGNNEAIAKQIEYLLNQPQPEQRTPEWYKYRSNLITASNAYKVWESPKAQNSLIYEKCCAAATAEDGGALSNWSTNINSPMHWGQKYEPMSVKIYETMFNTTVGEFGCIQHSNPEYYFIGASPDGINVDPKSPRYGRMLEIKNIVNREINGIPKKEYWVQMQLQMEVCDLDECDFLETRFTEYETHAEYETDFLLGEGGGDDGAYRGIIIQFSNPKGFNPDAPVYEYCPVTFAFNEIEEWVTQRREEKEAEGYIWIRNIYWKLAEQSCVLVCRNRLWFKSCVADMAALWKTVERERETGFSHREPTRRVKPTTTDYSTSNINDEPPNTNNEKKVTMGGLNGQGRCLLNITKMTEANT